MIYARYRDLLEQGDKKNDFTISQLHHHRNIQTSTCLLLNIYEVLLRAMYHRPHYLFFPEICHLCNGLVATVTPTHLLDHPVSPLSHIRPTIDAIVDTQAI